MLQVLEPQRAGRRVLHEPTQPNVTMNKLQLFTIACCATLGSCTLGSQVSYTNETFQGAILAKIATEDGSEQTWRVYTINETQSRIDLVGSKVDTTPKIGIYVSSVTRKGAEAFGTTPFRGVWVDKVVAGKPADVAGIASGQIILKVDGQEVHQRDQFTDLVTERGVPGEPLTFTVLHKRQQGDAMDTEQSMEVTVTPYGAKVRRATIDSIPLDHSKGVQTYTGLQVATIHAELAESIFATRQPVTIVTGVVPGSPAYNAGLRGGDRVLKVDGQSNPSLQDVRSAVLARMHKMEPTAAMFDLNADRTTPIGDGRSDEIQIEVDGPLGPHLASMTTQMVGDHTRFYIPIIAGYESSVETSKVSFLNFIFQFGFNYNSDVHRSATRAPVTTSELSILPLGMFGVKHELHRSEYRLFWLIRWSTENYDNAGGE